MNSATSEFYRADPVIFREPMTLILPTDLHFSSGQFFHFIKKVPDIIEKLMTEFGLHRIFVLFAVFPDFCSGNFLLYERPHPVVLRIVWNDSLGHCIRDNLMQVGEAPINLRYL